MIKPTITGHKVSITKSRSGHYTLTIREVGTWSMDGNTFPYWNTVLHEEKLELARARAIANEFKTDKVAA